MAEENVVWSERQLQNHLRLFPQGQLAAEIDGVIVGATASLIVSIGRDPYRAHTYAGITDGGYFHNHDASGDTLYGADVYVDPDCQGRGIGAALYEARRRLCKSLNLQRILAGGRLSSYDEAPGELSPEAYVQYKVRKIATFEDFANQVEYFVETAADYRADFVLFPEFFSV